MSKAPEPKQQPKQPAGGQMNWVLGFVLGAAVVGTIWIAVRRSPAPPQQAVMPAPAAAPQQQPAAAPPMPEISPEVANAPRISAEELKAKLDKGEAVTIDVRTIDDFTAGHIPGALQIPLQYVQGEIPWFPKDKMLVTYCTCPAEETSGQAVLILQQGGLKNAAALKGGLDHWRALGFTVEAGRPQ